MALILIADDDPVVTDIVRFTLGARGHVVGTVDNGTDALRVVEAKRPDLVILDCTMPGLGGVDVLRRMKTSATCFSTPVLMLTARSSLQDEEIAFRAGANDYLCKPFDPAELVVIVERMLNKVALSRRVASRA